MAKFIPAMPENFNGSIGEEKVFEALRLLDNNYTIFHSLNWIGINDSRTMGEADYVIIHPDKGIMVIEVKSGEIEYTQEKQWTQTNRVTKCAKTIAPFEQARKSQFEIIARLKSNLSFRPPLVCHAVWFPSGHLKISEKLPIETSKEIILDEESLNEVKNSIDCAFDFWRKKTGFKGVMDGRKLHEVIEVLAPRFHLVPNMKNIIHETENMYIRLTNQQTAVLNYLQEQKTAVIHGLAGTGKTVLAREKAKMLAGDGRTVLYLCYNNFLKEYLRSEFSYPGIVYHNAHSLAMEVLATGGDLDLDNLLDEFEEFLLEVIEAEDWKYDHIVIDEGQDLNERLVNSLYDMAKAKDGSFYVFYDRNQYIMKNEMPQWLEQAECKLVLHRNCRNTAEIFKTSCGIIGSDSKPFENSIHGETPTAFFFKKQIQLIEEAENFVKAAIVAGIEPEEIVFLTVRTEKKSLLSGVKQINGICITNERQQNNILFTTIRKFKGLEAKAVMIIDLSISALAYPENQRLVYVGCSRAKHLLKIAILEDIDREDYGNYLRKINSKRNVPKNKKGLGRLLNVKIQN